VEHYCAAAAEEVASAAGLVCLELIVCELVVCELVVCVCNGLVCLELFAYTGLVCLGLLVVECRGFVCLGLVACALLDEYSGLWLILASTYHMFELRLAPEVAVVACVCKRPLAVAMRGGLERGRLVGEEDGGCMALFCNRAEGQGRRRSEY